MNEPWFRQKEIGYGAGLPIHWKGWVLVGAYVAVLIGFPFALEATLGYPPGPLLRLCTIVAFSIPFLWVAKRKTAGGWHFRRRHEDRLDDR